MDSKATPSSAPQATAKELFEVHIPDMLKLKPELVADIKSSYQFSLSGEGGGDWYLDLTKQPYDIKPGLHPEPVVVVSMSVADFLELSFGKLNPQLLFMSGRLKIKGDLGLALKLQHIIVSAANT